MPGQAVSPATTVDEDPVAERPNTDPKSLELPMYSFDPFGYPKLIATEVCGVMPAGTTGLGQLPATICVTFTVAVEATGALLVFEQVKVKAYAPGVPVAKPVKLAVLEPLHVPAVEQKLAGQPLIPDTGVGLPPEAAVNVADAVHCVAFCIAQERVVALLLPCKFDGVATIFAADEVAKTGGRVIPPIETPQLAESSVPCRY